MILMNIHSAKSTKYVTNYMLANEIIFMDKLSELLKTDIKSVPRY